MKVTGEVGRFLQGWQKKSAAFLEQEGSYCGIFSEADRPVVSVVRLGVSPEKLKEMGANRPIGLISRDCGLVDCIQNCQSTLGFICLCESGGVSGSHADCGRYVAQLLVEADDDFPLNPAASRALGMDRLNRGFQLKPSRTCIFGRLCQMAFSLFY